MEIMKQIENKLKDIIFDYQNNRKNREDDFYKGMDTGYYCCAKDILNIIKKDLKKTTV